MVIFTILISWLFKTKVLKNATIQIGKNFTSRAFEIFLRIRKSVMVQEIKGYPKKSVLKTRAPRKAGFFLA